MAQFTSSPKKTPSDAKIAESSGKVVGTNPERTSTTRPLSKRPWICPRLWPASQTWTKIPNLFVTDSKPKRSWNARRPWWSQPWIQARWMKNRRKYICYILKSRTNHDFSHGQIWVRKCFRNLLLNIVNVFLLRTLFPSKLTVKTF